MVSKEAAIVHTAVAAFIDEMEKTALKKPKYVTKSKTSLPGPGGRKKSTVVKTVTKGPNLWRTKRAALAKEAGWGSLLRKVWMSGKGIKNLKNIGTLAGVGTGAAVGALSADQGKRLQGALLGAGLGLGGSWATRRFRNRLGGQAATRWLRGKGLSSKGMAGLYGGGGGLAGGLIGGGLLS